MRSEGAYWGSKCRGESIGVSDGELEGGRKIEGCIVRCVENSV